MLTAVTAPFEPSDQRSKLLQLYDGFLLATFAMPAQVTEDKVHLFTFISSDVESTLVFPEAPFVTHCDRVQSGFRVTTNWQTKVRDCLRNGVELLPDNCQRIAAYLLGGVQQMCHRRRNGVSCRHTALFLGKPKHFPRLCTTDPFTYQKVLLRITLCCSPGILTSTPCRL